VHEDITTMMSAPYHRSQVFQKAGTAQDTKRALSKNSSSCPAWCQQKA